MATATTPDARLEDERHRFRAITAAFRGAIVRDAIEIRAAKADLRRLQRAGSGLAPSRQSQLVRRRMEARARLIAYGLHRGVPLERMEAGRADLDQLPWTIQCLVREAALESEA
jgi:hypothetical protein